MRSPTKCPPCMCVCVFALSACKSSYPASQGTCRAEHTRALLRSPRVRKARSERGSAHAHSRTPVVKQVQAPQGAAVAYVSCPRAARGHHRRAPDPSSSPHRRSRSPPHTPTCAPAAPRVLTSVVCSRARAARSRPLSSCFGQASTHPFCGALHASITGPSMVSAAAVLSTAAI